MWAVGGHQFHLRHLPGIPSGPVAAMETALTAELQRTTTPTNEVSGELSTLLSFPENNNKKHGINDDREKHLSQ